MNLREIKCIENGIIIIGVGEDELVLKFRSEIIGVFLWWVRNKVLVPDVGPAENIYSVECAARVFEFGEERWRNY